jgi:hypothetical protein
MDQTTLYYNATSSMYFDENNEYGFLEDDRKVNNNFVIIMVYIFGFYHFSWYIIHSSRRFFTEDINIRLADCRTIFRILNENFEMFDKESVERMNTTQLLEDTLEFFGKDCSSLDGSDGETSEDSEESHSNEEIEAAKTLTSMGKNWEFEQ